MSTRTAALMAALFLMLVGSVAGAAPHTTAGAVTVSTAPLYLVGTGHAAFPGLARAPDGSLRLVWRQGSDHYLARDGAILAATIDGPSQPPVIPTTVLAGGTDYRDPSLSFIAGREYLTYFTGSSRLAAQGAYVRVDRSPPVRIDGMLPYAAIAAPVVKLPDGRLGATFYAREAVDAPDTAWMAWSSDGGRTWSATQSVNNRDSRISNPEPWLVVDGNLVHMFFRWGIEGQLAMQTSTDSGVTWGNARIILQDASGRPTVLRTAAGTLVMVYRSLPSKAAQLAYSFDRGAEWKVGAAPMPAMPGSPNGMTYAAMTETRPSVIRLVIGMERPDGSSALYGTYLKEVAR